MQAQVGQILNKRDQEIQLLLRKSPEQKAGYCTCPLYTAPLGWANHLSHPPSLTSGLTPTLETVQTPVSLSFEAKC